MKTSVNEFGITERKFARWLSKFPLLKKKIKVLYQYFVWISHKKKYKYKTNLPVEVIKERNNESFFGYYDKAPVSIDGKHTLFHDCEFPTRNKPDDEKVISIILQEQDTKKILLKFPTRTYNWQQGSRAHWLTNECFIYNDYNDESKKYVARVYSVVSLNEIKCFDYPVQDSYKDEYFISVNYQRLMALRPDYGYRNLPMLNENEIKNITDDGIWRVDYKTGKSSILVSIADVYSIQTVPAMESALHKVNHVMISPSGKNFIFIHRYYRGKKRTDRLFLANSENGELKLIADYEMVSHCFWVNDKTILAYLRNSVGKDTYNLVDISNGNFTLISNEKLNYLGDGHPHVNGDWFVTDTYPDKSRMQHLILVNWKTGEMRDLGEFFHGLEYSGETRCDLHPRFSPNGKFIFFDSVFSGKRQLYRMKIDL